MANSNTASTPACPRCRRSTVPLAREGDRQRFQCDGCSESFWAPAVAGVPDSEAQTSPRTAFLPISIPERSASDGALPKRTCEKCGKPYFNLGKRFETHVATCDGKKQYVVPGKRRRRVPLDAPTPVQIYASSIAALLARRAALEAEIRGIDSAVAEIEKLKGAGGSAPVPFVPSGSPPTL